VWGLPRQVAIDFSFSSDARRAFLHRKDYTRTYRGRNFALVKLGGAPVFCYFVLVMNFEAHLTSFSLFIGLIANFSSTRFHSEKRFLLHFRSITSFHVSLYYRDKDQIVVTGVRFILMFGFCP
jgi:hypothetical protein